MLTKNYGILESDRNIKNTSITFDSDIEVRVVAEIEGKMHTVILRVSANNGCASMAVEDETPRIEKAGCTYTFSDNLFKDIFDANVNEER